MSVLAEFIYLQLLDVLTTIAFLLQGVDEGNPIVRWVISYGPHPIGSLFMMKAFAVAMAIVCVYRHREGLLRKVNVCFAVVVVYNLVVLIITSPAMQ